MNEEVFIVSAVRTPIGSFLGSLAGITAPRLGAIAIKGAIEKAGITANDVEEVIMGNVLQANVGQAPARQAAKFAGLPDSVICTTINKVCSSGLKSIMLGAQSIILGDHEIVVAGGMESMSNVPFYIDALRKGTKMGNGKLIDGMINDGLWDVYNNYHMGNAAELCATEKSFSREEQDNYAILSYKRSARSWEEGNFINEVVPVEIQDKKGTTLISKDEEYTNVIFEKIPALKPVFVKDGTVTAANASTINDGAAAVVLMSGKKVKELGMKPLARIVAFADAEQAPEWFTTTPVKATHKVLAKAGMTLDQIDYFEYNEAFAVVALAAIRDLKLDPEKVNIFGGAVSLGHPIGMSGARIVVTLNSVLARKNGKFGLAAICNGGGGSSAMIIEKL